MSKPSEPDQASCVLIDGFIREIEGQLDGDQIIPESINKVCWRFYYVSRLLMCVTFSDKMIYIADIQSKVDNKVIASKVIDQHFGDGFLSGYCLSTDFNSFPSCISDKINAFTSNVLFKVGGSSWKEDSCHALIIDTNTFNVMNWKLPKIEGSPYGNSVSYCSDTQLLISVGGKDAHALRFDDAQSKFMMYDNDTNMVEFVQLFEDNDDNNIADGDEWKWNKLKSMNQYRYNPSCIKIDGYNKIMVAGGKDSTGANANTAEIYDIVENEWTNVVKSFKTGRRAAGMYCDRLREQIYLAGGIDEKGDGTSVETYDLNKDEWNLIKIPNSRLKHTLHPVLWMEDNCLLYIASICGSNQITYKSSNSLECIDLRIAKQWNVIIDTNLLANVFGLNALDPSTELCFLVCN